MDLRSQIVLPALPTSGRTTIVQETRSAFQDAMQHKFIAVVEDLSGREVLAFISNHHVGPDMEIELFMLKPEAGAGAPV